MPAPWEQFWELSAAGDLYVHSDQDQDIFVFSKATEDNQTAVQERRFDLPSGVTPQAIEYTL